MLFMVTEHLTQDALEAVGERYERVGRRLPDGVTHLAGWMHVDGSRCFQLMEAPDRQRLAQWMANWTDLVRFEVASVETSDDYWSKRRGT